ncbi:MAG: formate dehydrogenase subunit gamma [Candidatus Dormibacteria bacterium]
MTSTPISSSPGPLVADSLVQRFDATERWLHWALVVPFGLTFLTGMALFYDPLARAIGNREAVRVLHRFAGGATVLLPLLVFAFGRREGVRLDLRAIDVWTADDRAWLRAWTRRRLGGRATLPPQGRFNAGQKFNGIATAAAIFWLAVTGLLVFPGWHPPFALVENARQVHNLAWILLALLVAGHIYLSSLYPPTRPGLRGMIDGRVPRAWLEEHHPLAPELGPPPRPPSPESSG